VGRGPAGPVGDRAEQLAFRYLVARGLEPVARNFRSRGGEIDLIMRDAACLVFIEVRYRNSARFAAASHTVDHHKQRKIIRTAAWFLSRKPRYANDVIRFDIVAVEGAERPRVDWIRDAFRPNDSTL
jgi:putative endonuclease